MEYTISAWDRAYSLQIVVSLALADEYVVELSWTRRQHAQAPIPDLRGFLDSAWTPHPGEQSTVHMRVQV
jgi:hypothetical protein